MLETESEYSLPPIQKISAIVKNVEATGRLFSSMWNIASWQVVENNFSKEYMIFGVPGRVKVAQAKLGPIVLELIQLLSTLWGLGPWRTVQQKLEKDWIELVSREPCEIKLAFTKLNPIVLELIQPVVGQSYWSKFIQAKGEGLNHVAFSVSDWQQMASNLQSAGGKMVAGGVQDGMHWGYFQAEPGGMVVELEEKLYGKQQFQV